MKTLLTVAIALALSTTLVVAEDTPAPAVRTFTFTYEVTVPKPAGSTKRLDVWVPLPLQDELQKVDGLEVTATSGGKTLNVARGKDATYGNEIAHVGVDAPSADVLVKWKAKITRTEDRGQGKGPILDRYKKEDRLVPLAGKATELAQSLDLATEKTPLLRGKKIYDHVLTTMVYDKVAPGYGKGDFNRACEVGKGNCTDFHAKFIGIGRAAGIPVRFTMGVPLSTDPKGKAGGYHCWAHFHDAASWIPVDISEAQKVHAKDPAKAEWFFGHLDADRIALTVGRDITLVPAQKGEPLLFFAYPYVEADGVAVELPKESRTFSWE
jgi:transglutaminase-like putative cysteine protease